MKTIDFSYGSKDVQDICSLFSEGRLNLEPGFQRQSVWNEPDRKKLILSILQNYPIPSIFLYRTTDSKGKLKYDVLDGKQRLESIFMFQGLGKFRGSRFSIKEKLTENDIEKEWTWNKIQSAGFEHLITGYKVQTVEVSGELTDIIDLFVRINSTGKRLTSQEKRHAKYYHSPFLKKAAQLASRYSEYFRENRIISKSQMARMKHVELVCEILASIYSKGIINKKTAMDSIISGNTVNGTTLDNVSSQFVRVLNLVRNMFPNLKTTRFTNTSEFYSIFMYVWEIDKQKMVLNNAQRNAQAEKLLKWLSDGVDLVRGKIQKAKGASVEEQMFANYLFTTRGDSDSAATRKRRFEVLAQLLGGLYEAKDEKRVFTKEQRRLIWNDEKRHVCAKCGVVLSWENFTIDHIKPYSKGGKTQLSNAALMCKRCNSKKGAR